MKRLNFLVFSVALGVFAISSPRPSFADDSGPSGVKKSDSVFDEGTEEAPTEQEIALLRDWAARSRTKLTRLLARVPTMPVREAKEVLFDGFKEIVLASYPKTNGTLMRYVLNRALKIISVMDEKCASGMSGDPDRVPGVLDQETRILVHSAQEALKYYKSGLPYINGSAKAPLDKATLPYAQFGQEYADFIMRVNMSTVDASAQYNVAVMALGMLGKDMDRDQNRTQMGAQITGIADFLNGMPHRLEPNDPRAVYKYEQVMSVFYRTYSELGWPLSF